MSTRHRAGVPKDGFSPVREGVTAQALSSTGVGGLLGAEPLGRPPVHASLCEAGGQDGPGAPGRAHGRWKGGETFVIPFEPMPRTTSGLLQLTRAYQNRLNLDPCGDGSGQLTVDSHPLSDAESILWMW